MEQIVGVFRQSEVGVPVAVVFRKDRDQRADLLSMEKAIYSPGIGSGPGDEAAARREQSAQAVGCRTEHK